MGEIGRGVRLLTAGDLKIVDGLLQLREVVQALLTALGAQRKLVAALVQKPGEQLGDGQRAGEGGEALDERDEAGGLCPAEDLGVQRSAQGGLERAAVFLGVGAKEGDAPLSQIALGAVHDPQKAQIVLTDRHAQIA